MQHIFIVSYPYVMIERLGIYVDGRTFLEFFLSCARFF